MRVRFFVTSTAHLLRKTVGDIMIAKGYSQPPTGEPDFYVAYHSVAADGEEVGMRVYGYMGPISDSHYGTAWGTTWVATPERPRPHRSRRDR